MLGDNVSSQQMLEYVRKDYDNVAQLYYKDFFHNSPFFTKSELLNFLNKLPKGGKILDAGCGPASDLYVCMYDKGYHPIGIDFSESMLNLAKDEFPTGEFYKCDMTQRLPFDDNYFDGIIASLSLIHIPKELVPQTLYYFRRVLKPQGKLLLVLLKGNKDIIMDEPYGNGMKIFYSYFTANTISLYLKAAGFEVTSIEERGVSNEVGEIDNILTVEASNIKELANPSNSDLTK